MNNPELFDEEGDNTVPTPAANEAQANEPTQANEPAQASQASEPSWMTAGADEAYDAALDPNSRFRIQSTTSIRDVPCLTDENGAYKPEILGDILDRSQLTFGNGTVFQLDGANIGYGQLIQPGALIVAIGNVKGGLA